MLAYSSVNDKGNRLSTDLTMRVLILKPKLGSGLIMANPFNSQIYVQKESFVICHIR